MAIAEMTVLHCTAALAPGGMLPIVTISVCVCT